ncbi:AAA family ATPase [Candidatus Micrarchaeota archaeon]|jgi:hypothetical protein|nr:AAA family ATPase [Candidatus Micrarchaeota archaeon]
MEEIIKVLQNEKLKFEKTSQYYKNYQKRFIYPELSSRLNVLYGIRGSGKTTLLFQKYLESNKDKRIYLNAEDLKLIDLNLKKVIDGVEYLFGKDAIVFIDEINVIEEWEKIIKISYDSYPKMKFYITGSSSLNLIKSKEILARRAKYIHILPLSFREYVMIKYNKKLKQFRIEKNDLLKSAFNYDLYFKEILGEIKILDIVNEYIRNNLVYLLEGEKSSLPDLVDKAIFLDISKIENIETSNLSKFERLILILSASTETNYENLSKDLEVSKSTIGNMLSLLEKTELIKKVYPYKKGKTIGRKQWKYYFTVPAIREYYAKKSLVSEETYSGYLMEDIFASNFEDIYYGQIDFIWKNYLIEIGSKNKDFKQFKKENNKFHKVVVYNGLDISSYDEIIKLPFYIWYSRL